MISTTYGSNRSNCFRCTRTCSTTATRSYCRDYSEEEPFIVTNIDTYSNFEKIRKDVEKIKLKDPLEKIKQKKNWKAIQDMHRRR